MSRVARLEIPWNDFSLMAFEKHAFKHKITQSSLFQGQGHSQISFNRKAKENPTLLFKLQPENTKQEMFM